MIMRAVHPRCIYFLFRGSTIIYIGSTTRLIARLQQHRRNIRFDRVKILESGSLKQEAMLIKQFVPKLNKNFTKKRGEHRRLKSVGFIVAPVSMPKDLLKKVRRRAKENYGERKFSHHVCTVLATDLNLPPKTESQS